MGEKKYIGTLNLTLIILAYACTINNVTVGADLGTANTFTSALAAILIGWAVLSGIGVLTGLMGQNSRVTNEIIWHHIFGSVGAKIMACVVATCLVCWSFFDFFYVGDLVASMMPEHETLGFIIGIVIVAACALFGAIKGVTSLKWLTTASIPFALILFVILAIEMVKSAGGFETIIAYVPEKHYSFSTSVNLVVASFLPITGLWSDVTCEAKNKRNVVLGLPIGMLMVVLLCLTGILGATGLHCYGITAIAVNLGGSLLFVTNFFTLIAQANTVPSNTHVLSTEYHDALNIKKEVFIIAQPILAALASMAIKWFADISIITVWISAAGCVVTPILGVTVAEYWIIRKGNLGTEKERPKLYKEPIISWFVGACTAIFLTYVNPILPGTIVSFMIALVVHVLIMRGKRDKKTKIA